MKAPSGARWLRLALALGLAAAAWFWLLRDADFAPVRVAASALPAWAWALATFGLLAGHGLRARRLQREWAWARPVGWLACLRLALCHNAAVLLMPLRAGELGYVWMVHRQWGVSIGEAARSLLWWRAQDAAVLLVWGALLLPPWPWTARLVLGGALLVALVTVAPVLKRWLDRRRAPSAGRPAPGRDALAGAGSSAALWSIKLLVLGSLLAALAGLEGTTGLRGAMGGELAGVQPLQGPAGLGTYEAGVWAAVRWSTATADVTDDASRRLVAAALAVHAFSLMVALLSAACLVAVPRAAALSPPPLPDSPSHP